MRQLYTLTFYVALPLVLLRLYWRGRKAPTYRLRWRERLGCYQGEPVGKTAWIHAVSVGEAEAALPLIKLLKSRRPDIRFLVTTTTPTGSERVTTLLGDSVEHVYLPYDLPAIIERFFRHFQPGIAIFMEKEIWPNLLHACAMRQIPAFIVNARLSARSARAYQKIPGLIKPALDCVTHIAVQSADDRKNFIAIGADPKRIAVLGNIKFDVRMEPETISAGLDLKNSLFKDRFVWLVGSTHQGEEAVFIDLYQRLKPQLPALLLILAPRHPERFQPVKSFCLSQRLKVMLRSENRMPAADCDVYIADSIGELKMLYAAADLAFVAGSIRPVGGHNILEPAAVGVPVLFGPQMFNFQEIANRMLAAAAALQCADEQAIADAVLRLYADPGLSRGMTDNARSFISQNQGATARIADLLDRDWQAAMEKPGQ
ncbi:MAG: lipid IV(A) 3-deoxy-D-manno-octulosonic acid transferase [Methylococcales bacterium]|nr:lipid IV(A) 3-deoxy-D-manno-octulosonic acid transferase [Methylococcales bacterium]